MLKLIPFKSWQLQNSGQLQNNTVNSAVSITISRVIDLLVNKFTYLFICLFLHATAS